MGIGKNVHFDGPVDRLVVTGAARAVKLLHGWFPEQLFPVEITADGLVVELPEGGEAALFSGGVDSFHTVQRHLGTLANLLFIHGMDIKLDDVALFDKARAGLQAAAAELGLPLTVARTNMREFADRHVDWLQHDHGAAIASVALAHTGMWRRTYLASTYTKGQQVPLGSHVDLDPLWSTNSMEVVHDGVEDDRTAKVRAILRCVAPTGQ